MEVRCPMCGDDVDESEADAIEEDMEDDAKTCLTCGMTFGEIREAQDG